MAVRPLSAVLAISRNCFFKVVLSIFEGAKLARAIITTATTPYAIGIDSKIFRYFFGSAIISNGCLSALSRIGIGKTSMAETNRKSEYEYALMHLRLRGRHGWMKAAGALIGLPRELRIRHNMLLSCLAYFDHRFRAELTWRRYHQIRRPCPG